MTPSKSKAEALSVLIKVCVQWTLIFMLLEKGLVLNCGWRHILTIDNHLLSTLRNRNLHETIISPSSAVMRTLGSFWLLFPSLPYTHLSGHYFPNTSPHTNLISFLRSHQGHPVILPPQQSPEGIQPTLKGNVICKYLGNVLGLCLLNKWAKMKKVKPYFLLSFLS